MRSGDRMLQTIKKIASILLFFTVAFMFGWFNQSLNHMLGTYETDATAFIQLSYLRFLIFAIVFNLGFTLYGIILLKKNSVDKPQQSKMYQSFLKGIQILKIIHGFSWIYTVAIVIMFALSVPPQSLNPLHQTMTYAIPILTVLIIMFFGRDSTFVMDKDR